MSLFPKFQVGNPSAAIPAIPAIRVPATLSNSRNSRNSNAPIPEQQSLPPIPGEPSTPCPTCGSNHFWLSATGWTCWGCTEPPPSATTLCLPASQPTPDPTGNVPYRLTVGNVTRLVWLPPGLSPAEVLARAKAIDPGLDVTDSPPAHGWPRLADVPEIPDKTAPRPVECWTPSGKRLMVTAQSPEHAEAIRRLNPPPQGAGGQDAYEERAAIMEYDAGIPRAQAEQKAATCRYCRRWCGTRSGSGWCVVTRPAEPRTATESCEQWEVQP